MPQTIYIENDEEIISVISRLRHSAEEDNYLIFPKRSLVLQSMINLKLLEREAGKLGKKVVVVTQDDVGLTLAEKAGLATERYVDESARKLTHVELAISPQITAPSQSSDQPIIHTKQNAEGLGSNEFYASFQSMAPAPIEPKAGRSLRVRDMTPPKLTTLNSQRPLPESVSRSTSSQQWHQPFAKSDLSKNTAPVSQSQTMMSSVSRDRTNAIVSAVSPKIEREERLKNFYTMERGATTSGKSLPQNTEHQSSKESTIPSSMRSVLFFLGAVSMLSLIGVGVFLFLPRAEVHVTPYRMTQSVDLPFDGRLEGVIAGDTIIPVRIVTREQEITLTIETTGVASGVAQKSRGTVIINNSYSSDAQFLVATTRLESPDGKIFRLSEGVTVPGMNGKQAGVIEASVIADQTGEEYNIGATTFTIPGFKGGPKYTKFSAQSNKAMTGGSEMAGSEYRVISKKDIDTAEDQAKKQAIEAYKLALMETLLSGERILEENLEITSMTGATLPIAGTEATSFEYKNVFTVRGFIFSETAIKDVIRSKGEETINGIDFRPTTIALSYGEAIPDYENKQIRLKVRAIVDSESVIDQEKFLESIRGKNEEEINEILTSFPAIKKIEIFFRPKWLSSEVPDSKNRVTIVLHPGSPE